ncbi:MAG: ECF transporter S component [Tessaracoccus sp.]|uniref:ECF transporter S component n=1 Tax=Tessaracoccus sp. TaxID=1971211 RepID=UPI001ECB5F83|nr:ECF transporter S component [Tessaracoccus sp.]MBK7820746.1 ECF transporter S component [Tessaracoccus sp.]
MTVQSSSTRRIARTGILIALSVVGALIKIPSPTGSVALDAAPAFLAAFAFTLPEAMLVAVLGHLVSAATAGFPLSLPVHLIIAVTMAVAVAGAGWAARRVNLWAGVAVGILLNGVGAPLALVPLFGWGFFVGMLVPLLVGAGINVILAALVAKALTAAGLAEPSRT